MRQTNARLGMQARFIWAAMVLRLVHVRQQGLVDFTFPLGVKYSGYAAHNIILFIIIFSEGLNPSGPSFYSAPRHTRPSNPATWCLS